VDLEEILRASSVAPFEAMAHVHNELGRAILVAWDRTIEGYDRLGLTELEVLIEQLRLLLPDPPDDYDPARFIAANRWQPSRDRSHEYLLIHRCSDWRQQLVMVEWLRRTGEIEVFMGRRYRYRTVGAYRYWALARNEHILNRRPAPEPQLDLGAL
jgi:hypothetical protein